MHKAQACRQMVLIPPPPPAYSSERSLGEGRREPGVGRGRGAGGHQSSTSAARPVLADLEAVGAETEGAVSRHDAAVAAAQLVAGRQELCRVRWGEGVGREGEREKKKV